MGFTAAHSRHVGRIIQRDGQPVTLSYRAYQEAVTAIVDYDIDPVRFLEQGRSVPSCVASLDSTIALPVTTDWQVIIGCEVRPVLEAVNDKSGFTRIYLGDPL